MQFFNSIWNFVLSSASISTLIGCAAVFVAVAMPAWLSAITDLRKWAIVVAVIAFAHTAIAAKFYKEGLDVKQAQWTKSLEAEAGNGEKARSDAERTVRDAPPDSVRNDGWNRDNWPKSGGQ